MLGPSAPVRTAAAVDFRRGGGGAMSTTEQNGDERARLVLELADLDGSREELVHRLERIVTALALTLQARIVTQERLDQLMGPAGSNHVAGNGAPDLGDLVDRYRRVIQMLESIPHLEDRPVAGLSRPAGEIPPQLIR